MQKTVEVLMRVLAIATLAVFIVAWQFSESAMIPWLLAPLSIGFTLTGIFVMRHSDYADRYLLAISCVLLPACVAIHLVLRPETMTVLAIGTIMAVLHGIKATTGDRLRY